MEKEIKQRGEERGRGSKPRRLFVSLHISDKGSRQVAEALKEKFGKRGYLVVTPFDLGLNPESTFEEELWYRQQEVLHCHTLYLAPGWGLHPECSLDQDTARAVNKHRRKARRNPIRILFGTQRQGWVSRENINTESNNKDKLKSAT